MKEELVGLFTDFSIKDPPTSPPVIFGTSETNGSLKQGVY
jgi:hypothetical protein